MVSGRGPYEDPPAVANCHAAQQLSPLLTVVADNRTMFPVVAGKVCHP